MHLGKIGDLYERHSASSAVLRAVFGAKWRPDRARIASRTITSTGLMLYSSSGAYQRGLVELLSYVGLITGIILAITGIIGLGVGIWYTRETRLSRRATEQTLKHLKDQASQSFLTYVVPVNWDGGNAIQLTNLGPGPAVQVQISANYLGSGGAPVGLSVMSPGISAGSTVTVNCIPSKPFDTLETPEEPELLFTEITPYTIRGDSMPSARFRLGHHLPESDDDPEVTSYFPDSYPLPN